MPPALSDEQIAQLTDALRQGRKIEAIKLCRDFTGFGLQEAKDAVEQLETGLRAKFPGQFPPPSKSGCSTAAAGLLFVTGLAIYGLSKFWS